MFTDDPICPYGCKDVYSSSDYSMIQGIYEQIPKFKNNDFMCGDFEITCPKCKRKFNLTVSLDYIFKSDKSQLREEYNYG